MSAACILAGVCCAPIVTTTKGELRIYSTWVPAADRRISLMQDPLYRNDVTHRSMGYPHVPMTSIYLGVR
jgi:rhamnogalacturonan endolyase